MGGNVSMIDGHIDGADTCVVCGRDIPEGSQYCVICGKVPSKVQTNYDRIRNMTVEEMTKNLTKLFYEVARYTNAKDYIKQYLESEVTE